MSVILNQDISATRPLVFRYAPNSLNLFYAFDGNKNVSDVFYRLTANGIGAHYDYAPFGATTRTHRDSSASFDIVSLNPFRFSSEYYDSELDLVYYNYRHYSPALGRFLSRDPIEEQGGLNLYAFIENKSVFLWDALGKWIGVSPGTFIPPATQIYIGDEIYKQTNPNQGDFDERSFAEKLIAAVDELLKAFNAMTSANVKGGDKYFHCIGMCNATRNSSKSIVTFLAKFKEVFDLIKDALMNGQMSPTIQKAKDSLEDMKANFTGIDCASDKSCEECCCSYKVNGIK